MKLEGGAVVIRFGSPMVGQILLTPASGLSHFLIMPVVYGIFIALDSNRAGKLSFEFSTLIAVHTIL